MISGLWTIARAMRTRLLLSAGELTDQGMFDIQDIEPLERPVNRHPVRLIQALGKRSSSKMSPRATIPRTVEGKVRV